MSDAHRPATESPIRILVVDDDAELRGLVCDFLRDQAFDVHEASGGSSMRAVLARVAVDVVVLDVMMPGEDGLTLARELAIEGGPPIVMVSALGSETDRIVGLEVGADDYLPKPASPRELLARVRAVLRRSRAAVVRETRGNVLHFAGWSCDVQRRVLRDPSNVVVTLSQGEFALLQAFLEHPQRILTRDQLLEFTRTDGVEAFDRAIDTQTSRLRRKLASRSGAEIIRTIRSEGYMLVPGVERR